MFGSNVANTDEMVQKLMKSSPRNAGRTLEAIGQPLPLCTRSSKRNNTSPRSLNINSKKLRQDLRLLVKFVRVYCDCKHKDAPREKVQMKTPDVTSIAGKEVLLCSGCRRLLMHAFAKRTHCPFDPKPSCKKCPKHCYAPTYRQQMREVMKFSGRHLVLRGRIDYLLHLLF